MENLRLRKTQQKSQIKDKLEDVSEKNKINELVKKEILKNINPEENLNKNSLEEKKSNKDCEDEYFSTPPNQRIVGRINFQIDIISISLFICGLVTRMYKLEEPRNIV